MGRPRRTRDEAIAIFLEKLSYSGLPLGLPENPTSIDRFRFFFGPCWLYEGCKSERGYGRFTYEGRNWSAHRFAWIVLEGRSIAEGEQLDHLCRVPSCVNPNHLQAVSPAINMRRMEQANYHHDRQTCRFGHWVPWPLFQRMGCAVCRDAWRAAGSKASRRFDFVGL